MKEKNDLLRQLGRRITDARIAKGLTAEKLAYESGLSKGNLSEIERGLRDARYTTLLLLADGLDIPISKLLKDL